VFNDGFGVVILVDFEVWWLLLLLLFFKRKLLFQILACAGCSLEFGEGFPIISCDWGAGSCENMFSQRVLLLILPSRVNGVVVLAEQVVTPVDQTKASHRTGMSWLLTPQSTMMTEIGDCWHMCDIDQRSFEGQLSVDLTRKHTILAGQDDTVLKHHMLTSSLQVVAKGRLTACS
jgi:hypothetical protein